MSKLKVSNYFGKDIPSTILRVTFHVTVETFAYGLLYHWENISFKQDPKSFHRANYKLKTISRKELIRSTHLMLWVYGRLLGRDDYSKLKKVSEKRLKQAIDLAKQILPELA